MRVEIHPGKYFVVKQMHELSLTLAGLSARTCPDSLVAMIFIYVLLWTNMAVAIWYS